jgi:integrase
MAWIEDRGNGTSRVVWRANDGRKHSRTFPTRREAEALARTMESHDQERDRKIMEWATGGSAPSTPTVAEYLRQWIDSRERPPTTRDTYEKVLGRAEQMSIGKLQVGKVTVQDVWAFNRDLRTNRASMINVLAAVFNAARRAGMITASPFELAGLKRPTTRRRNARAYTGDEVEALVRAAYDGVGRNGKANAMRNALVIRLGANCGLRPGETAGLRVEDLDVGGCRLHVRRGVTRTKGGRNVGPTKSPASDRRVAIPCTLAQELGEYVALNPSPDGFIFHSNQGGLLAEDRIGEIATAASRKAKVFRSDGTPLTGHDLRHACASLLISAGWPLTVIQHYLGHSSIRVTSDVYGHILPDAFDQLAAGMEALRAPPDVPALPNAAAAPR